MPLLKVTPLKPKADRRLEPSSSRIADTTASSLTIKPLKTPVLALVFEITLQPVYPAEKDVDVLLINLFV